MSWTQPQCERCWIDRNAEWQPAPELGPDAQRLVSIRQPARFVGDDPAAEMCAFCGQPTIVGIYVRVDPTTVAYPRPDDDEDDE